MPKEHEERTTLGLSPAQVAGSALAAVSGALLASFAGTTGTIIGTAIGSIVATVGAAIYTWSLRRTSAAVRRTAAQVRQTALITGQLPRAATDATTRSRGAAGPTSAATGTPEDAVAAESGEPTDPSDAEVLDEKSRRIPWAKALLASAVIAFAALGGITAVEAVTGKPVSSWFGGDEQGTSVGHLVGTEKSKGTSDNSEKTDDEKPTTPTPTPTPTESATPTPTPTPTPTEQPSTSAEPAPSQAPQPSAAP